MPFHNSWRTIALAVFGAFLLTAAPSFAQSSDEKLGQDYHRQLSQKYRVYKDPRVTEIGNKVMAATGVTGVEFFAIDMGKEDVPNAFQIPYHIYATRSLLKDFDDTSLTFIMAHEMGHQVYRHGIRQARRSQNTAIGAILLGALLGVKSNTVGDYAIRLAGGAVINDYSREHEEEADLFGLKVIHDLGIPFEEAARSFEKLGGDRKEDKTMNTLFGSHPMIKDRVQRSGSADEWLRMRPTDIYQRGDTRIAVTFQYIGDRKMSDDEALLRRELREAMEQQNFTFQPADETLPIWSRLAILERLKPEDTAIVAKQLNVNYILSASNIDKGWKWEGWLYDVKGRTRMELRWNFNNPPALASLIRQALAEDRSKFKPYGD